MPDIICDRELGPFRVRDPEAFIADLRKIGARSEEENPYYSGLTYAVLEDERFWVGGYDTWLSEIDPESGEEVDLCEIIKKHIAPGEIAVLKHVGHEKLRYAHGYIAVITSEDILTAALDEVADTFINRRFELPFRHGVDVVVKESGEEEPLGIIIDVSVGHEVVKSFTLLYDDLLEGEER